jgi:ABC-type amino acid transport substrate-binding protein
MFVCPTAVTAMLIAATTGAKEPVTIATEGTFTPYVVVAPDGSVTGFEKEVADEVCLRAALDCDWTFVRFDELLPGLISGAHDIAIGGLAVTDERLAVVDFSQSYIESDDVTPYLGLPAAPPPETARVGVQSGTIYESHLLKLGRSVVAFVTSDEQAEALISGEVDLILGPLDPATEMRLTNELGMVYHGAETVPDLGTAMAICKGNTELKDRIDTALQAMRTDGTLDAITDRWFPG